MHDDSVISTTAPQTFDSAFQEQKNGRDKLVG